LSAFTPFYDPSDLSACVEAGESIGALNARIEKDGIYFPLWREPSQSFGELFARTRLCSRSFRFGKVKDNILGARFMLNSGKTLDVGGRVVKNVVGFDLTRYFAGSGDALGVAETLVLRLRPLPEIRKEWSFEGPLEKLEKLRAEITLSPWTHALDAFDFEWAASGPRVAIAYACGSEEASLFEKAMRAWAQGNDLDLREAPLPLHLGAESPAFDLSKVLGHASNIHSSQPHARLSGFLGAGHLVSSAFERGAMDLDPHAKALHQAWQALP